jgi:hypothetical protein
MTGYFMNSIVSISQVQIREIMIDKINSYSSKDR